MDDSAQTPQPTPVAPPQQPVAPVQGGQLATPPVTPPSAAPPSPTPTPTVGRHPEQAPVQSAEAVPTEPEPESATGQPSSDVQDIPEVQAPVAQESQPQVEISRQLQEAGVEAGPDAAKDQLPEEQKQIDVPLPQEPAPAASGVAQIGMTMSLEEATLEEKKAKSAKNSLSWRIREIVRELKKKMSSST